MKLATLPSLGLAMLLTGSAPPASAEEPEDARATAKALAERGDIAFAAGRCDIAIPLWKEADHAFKAPSIELRTAHCQALLGHVVDASATLRSIVSTKLAADAPPAFLAAQAQAASELPSVETRVATLVLDGTGRDAEVSLDEVTRKVETNGLAVDPGRHLLRVRVGSSSWEGPIELGDGEKRIFHTTTVLEPGPLPSHAARNAGFILGGFGLASVAVGVVAGVSALNRGKSLDAVCGPDRRACPPDQADRITQVKTFSLLSDLFVAGGVVLLGAGAYLVIRDLRAEAPPPRVRLLVTGAGASLVGAF